MKFSQTRKVTVFGIEITRTEIVKEFDEARVAPERRGEVKGGGPVALNPIYLTPIISQAVVRLNGLARNTFSFEGGNELTLDGNTDVYSGVQYLKARFTPGNALKVLFNLTALTNAYDKDSIGLSGAFVGHLGDILQENWETISPPSSS